MIEYVGHCTKMVKVKMCFLGTKCLRYELMEQIKKSEKYFHKSIENITQKTARTCLVLKAKFWGKLINLLRLLFILLCFLNCLIKQNQSWLNGLWFVIHNEVLNFHDWILCYNEPFHNKIRRLKSMELSMDPWHLSNMKVIFEH